jgi:dihydrodipicolinate synthase/N-acetylneuraminate lyase
LSSDIRGIFCPHMVPLDDRGAINETELRRLIDFLIERGISGLYPNGSTGEFVRLTYEERRRVIEIVADQARRSGREIPILAGASECNIDVTVDTLNYYGDLGCRAGAVVPPFYFKMSQDAVRAYFEELADRSRLDVILYNIPQFTNELAIETLVALCEHPRIVGQKDSSRDLPRYVNCMHKVRALRPDFAFLIGCEEILLPSLIMGGDGGTIATSGVVPEMVMKLYQLFLDGKIEDAKRIQYQILELVEVMLFGADFPDGFRAGMTVRGFNMGRGRQHQSSASQLELEKITRTIQCLIAEHGLVDEPAGGCAVPNDAQIDEVAIREIVARVMKQLGS